MLKKKFQFKKKNFFVNKNASQTNKANVLINKRV